jgi:hypothetical protein
MRNPREVDRYTSEDTARMQAIWTGIILAVVLFGASYLYFAGKSTDMTRAPAERHTTGSATTMH